MENVVNVLEYECLSLREFPIPLGMSDAMMHIYLPLIQKCYELAAKK